MLVVEARAPIRIQLDLCAAADAPAEEGSAAGATAGSVYRLIDIGPEGGNKGGEIIIQDTPEKVAREKRSYTGAYLKPLLVKSKAA